MTVEDTLIELQVVAGAALTADTNKDVGMIFNYYADSLAQEKTFTLTIPQPELVLVSLFLSLLVLSVLQ